jgi:hypothetical protein
VAGWSHGHRRIGGGARPSFRTELKRRRHAYVSGVKRIQSRGGKDVRGEGVRAADGGSKFVSRQAAIIDALLNWDLYKKKREREKAARMRWGKRGEKGAICVQVQTTPRYPDYLRSRSPRSIRQGRSHSTSGKYRCDRPSQRWRAKRHD